ncbi:DNA primase [Micrococcus lylae]|uniref:DNA primase n=1 Tax=Micrococcus lylae TaxID=1273 RepID=UPI000C7F9BFE|nr:DNA primase [Micrococcus lylae]WIK82152.1 hypothetical protein CJ228_011290 [Micrococcus lylae]
MKIRACLSCGASLTTRRADARTCSSTCRNRAARARRRTPVPPRMTAARRWVRWALRLRGASHAKVPLTVHGGLASSTRPATWSSHADVHTASHGAGRGFVLGDGVGCYDLDDALHRGQLTGWARTALAEISEPVLYVEVSQSGRGLHVFVSAPPGRGSVRKVSGGRIERYTTGRYIAMTGMPYTLPAEVRRATPLDVAIASTRQEAAWTTSPASQSVA